MANLRRNELKGLSKEDAKVRLNEFRKELMKLRSQVARGTPPENPGKIRSLKRNIARILTKLNIENNKGGVQ